MLVMALHFIVLQREIASSNSLSALGGMKQQNQIAMCEQLLVIMHQQFNSERMVCKILIWKREIQNNFKWAVLKEKAKECHHWLPDKLME